MSARRVRIHSDFRADLRAQLSWLVGRGELALLSSIDSSLDQVVKLLATFPAAGQVIDRHGTLTLRKVIFPKGPFAAWYLFDTAKSAGDVWLLRLFHTRQRLPAPKARSWRRRLPR